MPRGSKRNTSEEASCQEMPLWAAKMIEKYDQCATRFEDALLSAFASLLSAVAEIKNTRESVLKRLTAVEARLSTMSTPSMIDQNAIYYTVVKVQADKTRIEEKLRRITWVGIPEQKDEVSTRRFDHEALKEVVETSGDPDLLREFSRGNIVGHRFPVGQPRSTGARGRIIKIDLPSQELEDKLLQHTKQGRQSLTKNFIHSYARRDYTPEELELDRKLRRKAGELNQKEGKLQFVVRDLQIHRLRYPRDLPGYLGASQPFQPSRSSSSSSAEPTPSQFVFTKDDASSSLPHRGNSPAYADATL
ncbi:hypothetical protein Aduo_016599 [Ancylostoma duodenale]